MVTAGFNSACRSQRCLLIVALVVWLLGNATDCALATGSTQPWYDWNMPVPSSLDRNGQQTLVPHFNTKLEADSPPVMQLTKSTEPTSVQPNGTAATEDVSSAGPVVIGRVIYRGPIPAPMRVDVTRDSELCGEVMTVTTLAIDPMSHGVQDAIVHVGRGIETVDDVPPHVSIVQNKRCVFYPRVVALRTGTQAEITNDDPVMHNTNITLDTRTVLNVALVAGGNAIRKPLKKAGLHLVTCNVHKFMQAYRYAFTHPFFDQTNETGQFRILGLSAGLHTISVWHETLGMLHKDIQVPVRGTVTADFEFK